MTITVTADMAAQLRGAIEGGAYASSSEIIRDALRDWAYKRELREKHLEAIRALVEEGDADIAAGRVRDFTVESIVERGKALLAAQDDST